MKASWLIENQAVETPLAANDTELVDIEEEEESTAETSRVDFEDSMPDEVRPIFDSIDADDPNVFDVHNNNPSSDTMYGMDAMPSNVRAHFFFVKSQYKYRGGQGKRLSLE